eukprot:5019017-Amphidinium_carterae.1
MKKTQEALKRTAWQHSVTHLSSCVDAGNSCEVIAVGSQYYCGWLEWYHRPHLEALLRISPQPL